MLYNLLSSYGFQRAFVAGFSFGALLLGARVFTSEKYSLLLQTIFLAKFLQIANFGMLSGYFVSRYSNKGPLAEGGAKQECGFAVSLSLQLALIGAVALSSTAILWPSYVPGIVAFFLLIPIVTIEPLFRHRRYFFVSLLPDALLAVALYVVIGVVLIIEISQTYCLFLFVLLSCVLIVVAIIRIKLNRSDFIRTVTPLSLDEHINMLRIGLPVYFATALFALAISADRLIFPIHGNATEVATYFLGYQLTVGAMLFIASVNFVNVVDLGKSHESGGELSPKFIIEKLRTASLMAIFSLGFLGAVVLCLERYFLEDGYHGLTRITITLGFGMGCFYVAGTVTPVLPYLNRQMPLTIAMGIVAAILLANNILASNLNFGALWLASVTAICFAVFALVAVSYTLRVVSQHSTSPAAPDRMI